MRVKWEFTKTSNGHERLAIRQWMYPIALRGQEIQGIQFRALGLPFRTQLVKDTVRVWRKQLEQEGWSGSL